MPSRAWTMASSLVIANTAPFEAVSVDQLRPNEGAVQLTSDLRGSSPDYSDHRCSVDDRSTDAQAFAGVGFVLQTLSHSPLLRR